MFRVAYRGFVVATPRMLLRLQKRLKRFDPKVRAAQLQKPADEAWQKMLRRLDAEEVERRLRAVESALNGVARH
jgi:hypothetical protein